MAKTLIALAAIAAAAYAPAQPAISAGERVPDVPDDIAEKMVGDNVARYEEVPVEGGGKAKAKPPVRVRCLVDGPYGKVNDVALVPADDLKTAKESGHVDDNKAAVAYAMTLEQNKGAA